MKWMGDSDHRTPRIPGLSIRTRVNTGLEACSGSPDSEEDYSLGTTKGYPRIKIRESRVKIGYHLQLLEKLSRDVTLWVLSAM